MFAQGPETILAAILSRSIHEFAVLYNQLLSKSCTTIVSGRIQFIAIRLLAKFPRIIIIYKCPCIAPAFVPTIQHTPTYVVARYIGVLKLLKTLVWLSIHFTKIAIFCIELVETGLLLFAIPILIMYNCLIHSITAPLGNICATGLFVMQISVSFICEW